MHRVSLGWPVTVVAAAMLLAAGSSFAAGQADASAVRLARAGSPQAAGGTWGTAIEVPGTGALNTGGNADINSVSCASAGNCGAGGSYDDASGLWPFVASQTAGKWGTAEKVPGIATLGAGQTQAVSCATAGNCSAGGTYEAVSGTQVFVVSQTAGKWGTAEEVPGIAALNAGGNAALNGLSCATAGNCGAGGGYKDASGNQQAFVVSQTGGKWGTAEEVPGIAALGGTSAGIFSLSCGSVGNCSAGGLYQIGSPYDVQAFVVSETGGKWGKAIEVPGIAALNTLGDASIDSISCPTAGNCGAGGFYENNSDAQQAFVVSETGGKWGTAEEVPGTAALNTDGNAAIDSVSCATTGNCSAGGTYASASGTQAFVVSQTGGKWGKAIEVPGTATLNRGGFALLNSVSCATAGNCSAGGNYDSASGTDHEQAFVVSQVGGKWGSAIEVPGTAALNQGGGAAVWSLSCATAGNCSAGGQYTTASGAHQVFVVSETSSPRPARHE
jgi:hypothetical protein